MRLFAYLRIIIFLLPWSSQPMVATGKLLKVTLSVCCAGVATPVRSSYTLLYTMLALPDTVLFCELYVKLALEWLT